MACNKPLISVVVPVFNRKELICFTIDSLLRQQCNFETEIIVVDDGSTDGTIMALAQKYPQFVSSGKLVLARKNKAGISAARNLGIEKARGKYIAFCDSDDISEPDRLAEQAEFLENSPSHGMVHSKALWINDEGGILKDFFIEDGVPMHYEMNVWKLLRSKQGSEKLQNSEQSQNSEQFLFSGINPIHASSVMTRKDLLQGIKKEQGYIFDRQLSFAEDFDLWLRIAETAWREQKSLIGFLDRFHIRYRRHSSNTSSYNKADALFNSATSLLVKARSARRRIKVMQEKLWV